MNSTLRAALKRAYRWQGTPNDAATPTRRLHFKDAAAKTVLEWQRGEIIDPPKPNDAFA